MPLVGTKYIAPGYGTGFCSVDIFEQINCEFADQIYRRFVQSRYGVESCVGDEYEKISVKKGLLDLNLLKDPNACFIPPCSLPCGIVVTGFVTGATSCHAPTDPSAEIDIPIINCLAPTSPTADLTYNTPA